MVDPILQELKKRVQNAENESLSFAKTYRELVNTLTTLNNLIITSGEYESKEDVMDAVMGVMVEAYQFLAYLQEEVNEVAESNHNDCFKNVATHPRETLSKKRGSVLRAAHKIINGERNQIYGKPEDSFEGIAKFWSLYLGRHVNAFDVAMLMVLFKFSRITNGQQQNYLDSFVDLCGYAALGADMVEG